METRRSHAAIRPWLIAGLLLCASLTRAQASRPDVAPAPEVQDQLQKRGIALAKPEEGEEGSVRGFVLFNAPPDIVFSLLEQTDRQMEYRKDLSSLVRVATQANRVTDEQAIKILFITVRYRLVYALDPEHGEIHWRLAEGGSGQIQHISGSWVLTPAPAGRTLARFETQVRVGKGIPMSVQNLFTRRKLPKMLVGNREWVNRLAEPILRQRAKRKASAAAAMVHREAE